ncbi:hypothetical protein C8R44DRAFT_818955 [Mycena epipterygia]|nr:hypothetical protein C8R44DRAFT_818955 [Mycena epipterygia]
MTAVMRARRAPPASTVKRAGAWGPLGDLQPSATPSLINSAPSAAYTPPPRIARPPLLSRHQRPPASQPLRHPTLSSPSCATITRARACAGGACVTRAAPRAPRARSTRAAPRGSRPARRRSCECVSEYGAASPSSNRAPPCPTPPSPSLLRKAEDPSASATEMPALWLSAPDTLNMRSGASRLPRHPACLSSA